MIKLEILNFIRNNKQYLEDFITRSTYHSNAIEGSTLTYAETYAVLYNDNSLLKNNIPPAVIAKDDRVKYFELLRNQDEDGLAEWIKELSKEEGERTNRFKQEKIS